jgi:hypothetical protein
VTTNIPAVTKNVLILACATRLGPCKVSDIIGLTCQRFFATPQFSSTFFTIHPLVGSSSPYLLRLLTDLFSYYLFHRIIMRSFRVLVVLLFAFVAVSYASDMPELEARKDRNATHSKGEDSIKKTCKEMRKLTLLTSFAANQTKLDELVAKGKMNATNVDKLKAKAAAATTKLQTLTSNTTLTSECASMNANMEMKQQCKEMKKLQKLTMLASNTTAMDAFAAHKKLNETQVDHLKEKLQKMETKLKALQANTTLTAFCKPMKQAKGAASPDGMLYICIQKEQNNVLTLEQVLPTRELQLQAVCQSRARVERVLSTQPCNLPLYLWL